MKLRTTLVLLFLSLALGRPAFSQMNTNTYVGTLDWFISGSAGIFSGSLEVTGHSNCPAGGCPVGAKHYPTVTNQVNTGPGSCGSGQTCGGTGVGPQQNPQTDMDYTGPVFSIVGAPMFVNYQASWSVTCTVIGLIGSNTFYPAGSLLESAITWSVTYVNTNTTIATSSTCFEGYPPDWKGSNENPYGIWPSMTNYRYVEEYVVAGSRSGSRSGPWTPVYNTLGDPPLQKGWVTEPAADCTQAVNGVFPDWQ